MYKTILFLMVLVTLGLAAPPWEGEPPKQDTVFVVISGDTKEYTVADRSNPPMKIVQEGAVIRATLPAKFVGAAGALRDRDNNLVWSSKVPKSQEVEINTFDWKPGKYYGGIFNYKFGVIKD